MPSSTADKISACLATEGQQFNFPPLPVDIHFGYGAFADLARHVRRCGGKKAIIITDRGLRRTGWIDYGEELLRAEGIPYAVYDDVPENSSTSAVAAAVARLRDFKAEVIVGIGGGSALDTAKAVAAMATNPGSVADYKGLNNIDCDPLPCVCVPTAAGTGSEVSIWSVITDDQTNAKFGVGSQKLLPRIALCDPELTFGLPPALTAATGMDALSHAVESYTSKESQPISASLAIGAIELIGRHLRTAVVDGTNRAARYGMLLGSMMALMAMNSTRCGIAHALAMPMGSGDLRIHHGTIVGMLLPEVTRFNHMAAPERYAAIARAMGAPVAGLTVEEAAPHAVDAIQDLGADVGMPSRFSQFGMREAHIGPVVQAAMQSDNIRVNPRTPEPTDLEGILQRLI